MVMPGDNVTANFELIAPVAMEPGLRFALREGGRTVGAGVELDMGGFSPEALYDAPSVMLKMKADCKPSRHNNKHDLLIHVCNLGPLNGSASTGQLCIHVSASFC